MNRSLKRGIVSVLIANIISLFFSLLTNFILPKYLSIDSYSAIKTYQLYFLYIGILHFGYEDGMYLKYGGKTMDELNKDELSINLYTLRIFQIIVSAFMIVLALRIHDKIFLGFSLAILPVNLVAYYKLFFQAIGEFDNYGRVMNLTSFVNFIINTILIFVIQTDKYILFIGAYIVWNVVLWTVLELYFLKRLSNRKKKFSFEELISNIRMGIPLTLGNFSSILLTSIDRWFVKVLMDTRAFAQYSFAVSTESFMNVALTPIIVTLYNYFCKHTDLKEIKKLRSSILIFGSFVVSCAFGAKFIMEIFLNKYLDANNVLFLLFAAQLYYVVIKGVYVNIYKAQMRQNEYFKRLLVVVLLGVVSNALCYMIFPSKEAFAIGTLLSAAVWLLLCSRDFPELHFSRNEVTYLILATIVFLLCGFFLNSIIGFIVYIVFVSVCAFTLLRQELVYLINVLFSVLPIKKL